MNTCASPSFRPHRGAAALAIAAVGSALAYVPASAATFGPAHQPPFRSTYAQPGSVQSDAMARKPLLYVADNANSKISIFDVTKRQSPKPIGTITQGLNGPVGITTDLSGNLYVANRYGNNVTVYARGKKVPKATYSIGLSSPVDVRVDGAGTVYVANSPGSEQQSFIEEFPAGSSSPSYTWWTPNGGMIISGFALLDPAQPGLTPSIYAAFYTLDYSGFGHGGILSCYPGNPTCTSTGYTFGKTGGIAVEESPGLNLPFDFMISDQYVPGVDNFQQGQGMTQFVVQAVPEFLALNSKRTQLFVSDLYYSRVIELSWPGGEILNQYNPAGGNNRTQVYGVAVSPAGTYF